MKRTIISMALITLLWISFLGLTTANTATPPPLNSSYFQDWNKHRMSPNITEEDKATETKALQFLSTVFELNISSYNATIQSIAPAPFGVFMTIRLSSTESTVDVLTESNNSELVWCMLEPIKGSLIYAEKEASDVLTTAKTTLDSLQVTSTKDYSIFKNMLNGVTKLQNSNITNDRYTQKIEVKGNEITITWEPSANGLSNQLNNLELTFQNGRLIFFENFLDKYTIGSSEVKVSQQQAIEIATERVRAYSYIQGNETVSNVTILSNHITANLTLETRENSTLYPYWSISLPLDKMYPGGVISFQVSIWADTGEVASITPAGVYGVPYSDTPQPAETTQTNQSLDYSLIIAIALIAVVATTMVTGYLIYKKKR